MNPHVPIPSSNQDQLLASLVASPPLPSASPTPTPDYSGVGQRPQISSSVNISLKVKVIQSCPTLCDPMD